ncbi:MAG: DUF5723 family protein, partial [Bacteroidales bacterium]
MKSLNRILITSSIFLGVFLIGINGQIPNAMYFMPGVPQSNRINPAIQPGCNFYLGLPGVSPLRFQVSSSSLAFNDIVYYNESIDSLITPFHPLGDKAGFLENLEEVNYMMTSLGTSVASFGFRAGNNFFSVDVTPRFDGKIYYPKGIFELMFNGAEDGSLISLGGVGADINLFTEAALGWSRRDILIPNLDFGIRGKLLFGIANLSTFNS